jgi:uncharacterized protein (TIGR00251 family)
LKIIIKVKPWAKVEGVEKILGGYRVAVNAPAKEGKANARAIELLAKHFNVPKNSVKILSGTTARHKIVELPNLTQ